jgi:hypothetical protein
MNMRKLAALGAIAAAALGAQQAAATDFSYNLIEGSYISGDDFSGFGFAGAMEFTPEFFGHAGIDMLDADNSSADASLLSLGAGYSYAINNNLDIVATASLKRFKVDGGGSETGFGLGVGARGRLVEKLELHGGLEYTDIVDTDTTLHFGGRWYFTPQFAAGLDLQDNDFGSTLRFTARYDFGNRM